MVYFTSIKPTAHYIEDPTNNLPWENVVEIIFATKNPRKKGNKFEIEQKNYYILFEIKSNILYVINAKNVKGESK